MSDYEWHDIFDATPPVNELRRCDALWLFDGEAVFKGSFVDLGEDSEETESYYNENGLAMQVTHFRLMDPHETAPPLPPE